MTQTERNASFDDPTTGEGHDDSAGSVQRFPAVCAIRSIARSFPRTPLRLMLFLLCLAVFAGARGLATEYRVPDDYPTITKALEVADDGDTILVAAGTYSAPGESFPLRLQKAVTLKGDCGNKPHLKGDGEHTVVLIETGGVTLQCFRITDGSGSEGINKMDGGGICIFVGPGETRDVNIVDCVIENNTCPSDETYDGSGGGIYCGGTYCTCFQIHISDCIIRDNYIRGQGGGVCCALLSNVRIRQTRVENNTADDHGGGVFVDVFALADINDSHLLANSCPGDKNKPDWGGKGGGLACEDFGIFTVRDSVLEANTAKYYGGGIFTRGALFSGEHVCGGGAASPYVSGCLVTRNHAGVSGGGAYVASTGILRFLGTTLYRNDADQDGGGVFVAGGAIVGGEVHFAGVPPSVDLDKDGCVDGKDLSILALDWRIEGQLTVADINRDKIVNFSDLHELATYWPQGDPPACSIACRTLGETEGGVTYSEWGDCKLEGNECGGPAGGGRGGGVYLGPHALGTFGCTRFLGNSALFDGGALFLENEANAVLTNCLVTYNNSARGYAGGIRVTGLSYLGLDHCSVVGNFAPHERSGLHLDTDAMVGIKDSILWRNAGGSIEANGAIVNIITSLNEDGPDPDNGVICCDPNYVGWGGLEDIHVDPSSSCPGAGTSAAPYCDLQHALDGFDFHLEDTNDSPCVGTASDGGNMGADTGVGGLAGNITADLHLAEGMYDIRGRSIICINDVYGVGAAESSVTNAVFGHIEDCNIMDLSITDEKIFGGFVVRADANFVNCNIYHNHADADGGGIYVAEGHCSMRASTVSNNTCPTYGGGLFLDRETVSDIATSQILSNKARQGGGICAWGSELDVDSTSFEKNRADRRTSGDGGAIYVAGAADVNIADCDFISNFADDRAGAVACYGGETEIDDSTFETNAADQGGAIDIYPPGSLICRSCRFIRNSAWPNAGAVQVCENTVASSFLDCRFQDNGARNGGAVVCWDHSQAYFERCWFEDNSARWGGDLYLRTTETKLLSCDFRNSSSNRRGGVGLMFEQDASLFEYCHIQGSTAGVRGGAFSIENSAQPRFSDVNIVDCIAGDLGGGVAIFNTAEPNFVDVNIINCDAIWGGGVYASGDSKSTFRQCELRENSAYDLTHPGDGGGAYFTEEAVGTFAGCVFQNNCSEDDGGGIGVAELAIVDLWNTLIADNNAMDDGAGIHFMSQAKGTLTNCTLALNNSVNGRTGAGIFLMTENTVTVDSSIIWGNNPDGIRSEADPNVSYSCTQKDWDGPGNIVADPNFADPNDGDFHLKSQAGRYDPSLGLEPNDPGAWVRDSVTSPCIDTGNPALPVGDEPVPNGGRINMGAYGGTAEASKSLGVPPYVDLNNDGCVDGKDFSILSRDWRMENLPTVADINLDNIVDFKDLHELTVYWPQSNPPPRSVACWKLDETEGSVAHDECGDNDADLKPLEDGPMWTDGKIDGALQFDGVDDYLDCGDSDTLGPEQMALSMWISPGDMDSCHIVSRASISSGRADYFLMRTPTGKLEFFVGQRGGGPVSVLSASTTPLNEWSHVAVLLDESEASIYIDGELDAAADYGERLPRDGYRLVIGSHQGVLSFYCGIIDEIELYNQPVKPR